MAGEWMATRRARSAQDESASDERGKRATRSEADANTSAAGSRRFEMEEKGKDGRPGWIEKASDRRGIPVDRSGKRECTRTMYDNGRNGNYFTWLSYLK